ncbi:MAG: hypothetical protein A2V67_09515 [Deltaproteobacteria bacterium RBG_13_61_14]|nr:MAG: hypothetical protein A2V67_09515 [Deltaproteobacteria bacterium RBG_13_61_14]
MKKSFSRLLLLLITLWPLAPSWPADKISVAVYPIKAVGAVDQSIAANLTALLGYELAQSPKLLVVKEDMLKVLRGRQAPSQSDLCDSIFCQVEIGKLVQKMVVGELLILGPRYILTLSLVDVRTGNVDFSDKVECLCPEDQVDQLAAIAGNRIREHFGESGLPVERLTWKSAALPRGFQPSGWEFAYVTSPENAETMRQLDQIFQDVSIDAAAEQSSLDQGKLYSTRIKNAKPDKYYASGIVEAPSAVVWQALSDVEKYEKFLPGIYSISILENAPDKAVIQIVSNIRTVTTELYFDYPSPKMFWKELEDSMSAGINSGVSRVFKVEPLNDHRTKLIMVQEGGRFLSLESSRNEMEDLLQDFKKRAEAMPK